jgi:Holliday junction resolvase
MSSRNKQRGYELEAETVKHWQGLGLECKRVFGSGAYKQQLGDEHAGDLMLSGFTVECKRKKSGFKFLYDSLAQDDADMLVVRQDRAARLYIMSEGTVEALFRQSGIIK